MSASPTGHIRHLSRGGGGSRRGSFASGSRRGSLCPRIAANIATRLVLNALFGYIHADDEWDDPHFMLPPPVDGIRPCYGISDYLEAVEHVLSQLELEIALATSMSGLDPTATGSSSAVDLIETAFRNGIITQSEYDTGASKLQSFREPLQVKKIIRSFQNEWKKLSPELIMTPVMLQQTYQVIRGRSSTTQQTPEESQIRPEDIKTETRVGGPAGKKYSISFKRKSSLHSMPSLHTIRDESEDEARHKRSISKNKNQIIPPPQNVQACCIVM